MANASDVLDKARQLLQEGKVDEAADHLRTAADEERSKESVASGKPPAKKPPRSVEEVLHDLVVEIASHIGNPPRVQVLLDELFEAGKVHGSL
jgi:hypothetical protein